MTRYWSFENQSEKESLVLLKGFQSLKFFYASAEDLLEEDWQNEWVGEWLSGKAPELGATPIDQLLELPFPSAVKIEGEKENKKQSFFFPISTSYLKSWNPRAKDFPGFPEWKSPKKESSPPKKTVQKPQQNRKPL